MNLFRKNGLRTLLTVLLVLTIGTAVSLIVIHFYQQVSCPLPNLRKASLERYTRPRYDIHGFKFEGFQDGKKVITIKADRFTIEKKKLGFFRFGLMNEARLENAFVRIFCEKAPTTAGDNKAPSNSHKAQTMSFGHVLSKDSLPPMPVKRISSVVMAPVRIELYKGRSIVTAMSAWTGRISLKKRQILFKGSVEVVSGPRILKTDRLTVIPDRGVLRTDYPFILTKNGNKINGKYLLADLFLDPLVER